MIKKWENEKYNKKFWLLGSDYKLYVVFCTNGT